MMAIRGATTSITSVTRGLYQNITPSSTTMVSESVRMTLMASLLAWVTCSVS